MLTATDQTSSNRKCRGDAPKRRLTLAHALSSSSQESNDACDVESRKLACRDSGNRGGLPHTGAPHASAWSPTRPDLERWRLPTQALTRLKPPSSAGWRYFTASGPDEAAEAFRAAQAADPGFAMAFWGEAVTYSHLLWGEDDVDAARRVLNRLAPSRDARLAKRESEDAS